SLACAIVSYFASPASAQQAPCNVPEVVLDNQRYNELACDGIRRMERGDYANAARVFEDAMRLRLFEVPNFQLYARLALAYSKLGDARKVEENLDKGRLSLLVLTGAYRCEEVADSFRIVDRGGKPVGGQHVAEIVQRMCGAAYEPIYEDDSLETFVSKARIVENYLGIAHTVGASRR